MRFSVFPAPFSIEICPTARTEGTLKETALGEPMCGCPKDSGTIYGAPSAEALGPPDVLVVGEPMLGVATTLGRERGVGTHRS
jgi:hypothetical protein